LGCARIESARLSRHYLPTLQTWAKPQLVTLTVPSCDAQDLPHVIRQMERVLVRLNNRFYKQYKRGTRFSRLVGLRKLECTFHDGRYHPHFHFLLRDADVANDLQSAWLEAYHHAGIAAKAQSVMPLATASVGQTLNYLTKPVHFPKQSTPPPVHALDCIFRAFKGKQVIQDYKDAPWLPPVDSEFTESRHSAARMTYYTWDAKAGAWVNSETGHCLT
jgi:hypothetical protein